MFYAAQHVPRLVVGRKNNFPPSPTPFVLCPPCCYLFEERLRYKKRRRYWYLTEKDELGCEVVSYFTVLELVVGFWFGFFLSMGDLSRAASNLSSCCSSRTEISVQSNC